MQFTMPKCAISVRSGDAVLPLNPENFEFIFHVDDRMDAGRGLTSLMSRLSDLGFDVSVMPVSDICAYRMARRAAMYGNTMTRFDGGGRDWLENLVATLELMRALNAAVVSDQYYDPCSI